MKKLNYLVFFFFTVSINCQEISTFFEGKTFELKHFIKNGKVEELDLKNPSDPSGNATRGIPFVDFNFSADENQLEASINGYCNGTEATYKIFENYLEVLERGATTLSDCGGDEALDYFFPIKGQISYTETTDKVFYEFTDDKKGISIWIDENHKLYFTQKVLSVAENIFEKSISFYPNPSKEILKIDVKSASIKLSKISIIDSQGREIIKKSTDLKSIDISNLSKRIYFLKITGSDNLSINKKFIKE